MEGTAQLSSCGLRSKWPGSASRNHGICGQFYFSEVTTRNSFLASCSRVCPAGAERKQIVELKHYHLQEYRHRTSGLKNTTHHSTPSIDRLDCVSLTHSGNKISGTEYTLQIRVPKMLSTKTSECLLVTRGVLLFWIERSSLA